MEQSSFSGKVALVTGGASGIGAACVRQFAYKGAAVVVSDVDTNLGEKLVHELTGRGHQVHFIRSDVADPISVKQLLDDIVTTFGQLDIAVNNAGIAGETKPTGDYSIENWQRVINTNLNGVFYGMRYEIPVMLERGSGVICNMASILGSVGFAQAPAYVAAKHGIVGLTKAAALEYGQFGIRINSVGPGFIKTPMIDKNIDADTLDVLAGFHPIGRIGEADEVAGLVLFLCSSAASFITGSYYTVDGGYTAQ